MANYRKSFNFRSGVQVDDDNFIVDSLGKVGIGTTIPSQFLDVVGNAKISGLTTSGTLYTGFGTVGSLKVNQNATIIGNVTANTFFGSASGLTGIYAIAVEGWYVNPGTISTTSKVAISTDTLPVYSLQVGGDPVASKGISFDALTGDINSTGNIKALSFSGSLNASDLSSGTVNNSRLPSQISVGIVTASSGFFGNVTGIASTAKSLTGTPDITVGVITSTTITNSGLVKTGSLESTGVSTFTGTLRVGASGTIFTNVNSNIGIGTTQPQQKLSIVNGNVEIRSNANDPYVSLGEKVAIGTEYSNSPSVPDLQIWRNSQQSILQILSNSKESIIAIGRSSSISGYNGAIRYGNTSSSFPYSTPQSLDILNYGPGNVNFYLEASNISIANTGSFYWHRKPNSSRLMTLTYTGNLGIGITLPSQKLHVVGTSTVTNNCYVGSNLYVAGDAIIDGTLTPNNLYLNQFSSASGTIDKFDSGCLYVGIAATVAGPIDSQRSFITDSVGIATNPRYYPSKALIINEDDYNQFWVTTNGKVGVKTSTTNLAGINAPTALSCFGGIIVGSNNTNTSTCAVDFGPVGTTGPSLNSTTLNREYMRLPRVTNTQLNNFTGLIGGEIVYNTSTNKVSIYIAGTVDDWIDLN